MSGEQCYAVIPMKAYLIITGSLFALLAIVHVWRIAAEWPALLVNRWAVLEAAIGLIALALSIWAWTLLRGKVRS